MTPKSRVWPVVVSSLLGIVLLCSLGTWQVFRLAEKTAQISKIDAQIATEPLSLAAALNRQEAGEDINYVVVAATGHFVTGTEIHKLTTHDGGPGYSVLAPFLSDDGILVLVDRGSVPEQLAAPETRLQTLPAAVTGYVRIHNKGQGFFDGDNVPERNQWYWWDVPAMLGTVNVPADSKVLNAIVHRLPGPSETVPPIAPAPKADLRNNHLGYAITWFGLAAALAVVAGIFVMRQRHHA
jgi:surfeit locus 1 family protein